MELPECGDAVGIRKARKGFSDEIAEHKKAIKRLMAMQAALRGICDHKMESDNDPRWSSSTCSICGHTPGAMYQTTIYG